MGRRRKSQAPAETPQITAFREAEKRYRPRTRTPTDYSDVLDLRDGAAAGGAAGAVRRAGPGAYELTDRPGLFVLPGVVAPDAQRRLAFCCYGAYHRPPAETNLTWLARRDGTAPPPRTAAPPANLRWATLGRHYNWTERTYACDHAEPMPRHVAELCDDLCAAIGSSMNAEAAIVNYYRPGDTMGGHVDDAETDRSLPLVSVSLGCSAVFLVGGATRDVAPTAVWLRSGLCGKQPVSSIKYVASMAWDVRNLISTQARATRAYSSAKRRGRTTTASPASYRTRARHTYEKRRPGPTRLAPAMVIIPMRRTLRAGPPTTRRSAASASSSAGRGSTSTSARSATK